MARGLLTFVTAVAAGCCLGACAHVAGGGQALAKPPADAGVGELGDDLPGALVAEAPLGALGDDLPSAAEGARPTGLKPAAIDMPVGRLCARAATRAVVDRDLPGLTSRPEFVFFKHMSLRQLQAASGGQMSAADLQQVSADLGALPPERAARTKHRRRTLLVRIASILP